jgi:hypothetical protein
MFLERTEEEIMFAKMISLSVMMLLICMLNIFLSKNKNYLMVGK